MKQGNFLVAVDVGGTFTDFLAVDEATRQLLAQKVLTSYPNPSRSVESCLRASQIPFLEIKSLRHGTTIGINTIIERKAPPAALVATAGFRDVLELRRGSRSETWNPMWRPLPVLIPRNRRIEVNERVDSQGRILVRVSRAEVDDIAKRCASAGIRSVGVCLINSYVNPENERVVGEMLRAANPSLYVSISSDLSRELGEYERSSTTAINAMLQPVMSEYLEELELFLAEYGFRGSFHVVQSTGGITSVENARRRPCLLVESGPAAGAAAAAQVASACGMESAISLDMGGTTAKACVVIDGVPQLTDSYLIGGKKGYVVRVPGVDIVEVGTGGGSIAHVDTAGGLRVGPRSAGVSPGPACYGQGGSEPTITDANLLLGRLNPIRFAGGIMDLDTAAAEAAIDSLTTKLGYAVTEVAAGIVEIANVQMAGAVRSVTVERGLDPREFALVAYGGAGPLHACDIARQLHIPMVLIPPYPGHFSALGMLLTKLRRDYVRTEFLSMDTPNSIERLRVIFEEMRAHAADEFASDGIEPDFEYAADICYSGQHHTVTVRLPSLDTKEVVIAAFEEVFTREFGHRFQEGTIEIVSARLGAVADSGTLSVRGLLANNAQPEERPRSAQVYMEDEGEFIECPLYNRHTLRPGATLGGPALIEEEASTTFLRKGDEMTVNDLGCLVISLLSG